MQKLFYPLLFLIACSCASYPEDIEEVLRQAGSNRKELEKVLNYYGKHPADSLKLRAAEFLIANMPGKYSVYYDAPWNDVATVHLRWTSSSDKQKVLDTYRLGEPVKKDDLTHITAEYLINNIELAFKVWQEQPWGKDIPFDVFCEEILPYRVGSEPLENWREKVLASFADPYESFRTDTTGITAVEACCRVNDLLPRFRMDKDFPAMSYSQLMATTRGFCDAMADLAVFVMRGLGIPVTREFTPQWVGIPTGHSWNSVRDSGGVHISFMGAESNPGKPHLGTTLLKAKTYRQFYSKQQNVPLDKTDIPPFLRNISHMVDVTSEYGNCADVQVPVLDGRFNGTGYAFLSIIQDNVWNPVGWGTVTDGHIQFQSVEKDILYLPVYYRQGGQLPASYPFLLNEDGSCHLFKPDTAQMESTVIKAFRSDNPVLHRMLHGRFEGANRSDFSDAQLLYTIEDVQGPFFHSADIQNSAKFRYIRYYSPNGIHCVVAELEFYDTKGNKLNGTIIGTPGAWWEHPAATCDKVFDGDVDTFYDAESANAAWAGLDLGEPAAIGKIRFLPHTNGNIIYKGLTYELFYWDGEQMQLLSEQVAADYQLHCQVPANAMFFLKNKTGHKTGHYFVMKDGKQKWF